MRQTYFGHFEKWLEEQGKVPYAQNAPVTQIVLDAQKAYGLAVKHDLPKGPDEIQRLVSDIEKYYFGKRIPSRVGGYVSAAINTSSAEGIELLVKRPLSYLGLNNNNDLTIIGNVKDFTGLCMLGGKLVVTKNAKEYAGSRLRGGEITVKGNCGRNTGDHMYAGKIVVLGNCEKDLAVLAKGGVVEVHGELGDKPGPIARFTNASVYHKGILINAQGEAVQ